LLEKKRLYYANFKTFFIVFIEKPGDFWYIEFKIKEG